MGAKILAEDHAAARVRVLFLSNPGKKNALDGEGLAQLMQELGRAADEQVRALVLAGEGPVFSAGYDLVAVIGAAAGVPARQDALHGKQNTLHDNQNSSHHEQDVLHPNDLPAHPPELPDAPLIRACAALELCPLPIVAALDGPVFGAGVEVAAACDLRVASSSARFCLPPAKLGIVYSPEGTARVIRLVGFAAAKRMFFTAAVLDSVEAARIGLCDELLPATETSALPRALALASQLAQLAPKTHAGMKRTYARLGASLTAQAREELHELRREAFQSADAREGLAAFTERRAPAFTNR